jgi:hypothetical protein
LCRWDHNYFITKQIVAFVAKVERGGDKRAPQAYIVIRRG